MKQNKTKPIPKQKSTPTLNKQEVNIFQNISSNIKYKSGFSNHTCFDKALCLLCPTQEGMWAAQTNKQVFIALKKEVIYAQTTCNQVNIGKIQTHATNPGCILQEAFLPNASVSLEDFRWSSNLAVQHSRLERELISQHVAKHQHEQVITMAINF